MEKSSMSSRLKWIHSVFALFLVLSGGFLFPDPAAVSQMQGPQPSSRSDFSPAHLCARCHLHDMVEWGVSKHSQRGVACTACHGPSEGHVLDERNNIKPDRILRGGAAAALCLNCHQEGCPRAKRKDACQTCHHVHALLDVRRKPGSPSSGRSEEELLERSRRYHDAMKSGDSLVLQSKWKEALERFQRALQLRPGDLLASGRVAFCRRRLNPQLKGFQVLGDDFDPVTGWPARVEVPWLKLRMVLIGGGTIDIGDPTLPDSRLVHTVHVEPFYLSQYEVTQEQWLKVMGFNPSAHQDGFRDHLQMPAENISWKDCQQFIERLNGRVDGKGFRLPTEAEWEYVARKGAQNNTGLDAVAWYRDNAQTKESRKEEPTAFTAPRTVGLKSGSALGLYDMQGNVWEWCSTLFWPYPYNPHDGREDSTREGLRALRGGSYADRADLLAVGLRHGERSDRRFRWNGLRLARSVPSD